MSQFLAEVFTQFAEDYQRRGRQKAPTMNSLGTKACRASFSLLRRSLRDNLEEIVKNTLDCKAVPVDCDYFRAGMFLACPLMGGTGVDADAISRRTGIPRSQCAAWISRAQELGIFSEDGGVYANPWVDADPLAATINFVLDVCTLTGKFVRIGARDDPNARYGLPGMIKQ